MTMMRTEVVGKKYRGWEELWRKWASTGWVMTLPPHDNKLTTPVKSLTYFWPAVGRVYSPSQLINFRCVEAGLVARRQLPSLLSYNRYRACRLAATTPSLGRPHTPTQHWGPAATTTLTTHHESYQVDNTSQTRQLDTYYNHLRCIDKASP